MEKQNKNIPVEVKKQNPILVSKILFFIACVFTLTALSALLWKQKLIYLINNGYTYAYLGGLSLYASIVFFSLRSNIKIITHNLSKYAFIRLITSIIMVVILLYVIGQCVDVIYPGLPNNN